MTSARLDPFRQNRAQEVAERWHQLEENHRRTERLLWLGTMTANFDRFELKLLEDLGFMSISDRQLLTKAEPTQ